ncbi:hypothetical protein C8J57DRAFT_1532224 [Mycena rebaudengoi]|nr:hypothetical protein C8J57DRAFT_1532224 [Mycena rebaudengoi]
MHLFGQIPILENDGFILCETHAICSYVAEKFAVQGTTLLPTDLKGRSLFEQAALFEYTNFHLATIFLHFVRPSSILVAAGLTAPAGNSPTLKELEESVAAVSAKLADDVILGKHRLLARNELTLVDLFHLYCAPHFVEKGVDVMTAGNVAQYVFLQSKD